MSIWDDEQELPQDTELAPANPVPLADRRAIDLIECPSCRTVQSIGSVDEIEEREEPVRDERGRKRKKTLRGVFCGVPSCGRWLFDQNGFLEHMADRRVFDRDQEAAEQRAGERPEADATLEGAA